MKNRIGHFDLWIASITMFLMVFVVVIQVIFRYSGHPLSWPEEVARWMMIWITFAGASYAFRNGGLIRVDYFVKKFFSYKMQRYISIGSMILMVFFFAVFSYSALHYMLLTIRKVQVYPVTRVHFAVMVFSLILGGVLSILFAVKQIFNILCSKEEGESI